MHNFEFCAPLDFFEKDPTRKEKRRRRRTGPARRCSAERVFSRKDTRRKRERVCV